LTACPSYAWISRWPPDGALSSRRQAAGKADTIDTMDGLRPRYAAEVAAALAAGDPVVALESTLVTHGLPRPDNLRVAREVEQIVRRQGATPATIGMISGELVVGLSDAELVELAGIDGRGVSARKLGLRDLAVGAAAGVHGSTTVASTSAVAAAAGIAVFATGGLGGVHREAPGDESADLTTLARTPIVVVCAGVKSILDIGATLERLETLGVAVAGYQTTTFPGFYVADSGFRVEWSFDSVEQIARAMHASRMQRVQQGAIVVANPVPPEAQLDPTVHARVLADGLARMRADGVTGKDVTPYLLAHFHAATNGESLAVNTRIVSENAALGARIAVAYAAGLAAAGTAGAG
jgi:pseudouridylate synthase